MAHAIASGNTTPTSWGRMIGISVVLSLIVGVILLAFAWPAATAEPKDLPVGIVGEDTQVEQVESAIDAQADGAVTLSRYEGREQAVSAIEQREVYGAVVLGAEPTDPPEVLTASAANPQVAQILSGLAQRLQAQIDQQIRSTVEANVQQAQEQAAQRMQQAIAAAVQAVQSGQAPPVSQPPADTPAFAIPSVTVDVTDVVPLADTDPRGTGLAAAMFPIVIGGMIGGIGLALAVRGGLRRTVGVLVYSAAAGIVLAWVLQGVFGALQGEYLQNATALALAIAAVAGTITGLAGLLGVAGAGLGAVFMMLFANPISGAAVPPQFLLAPWGDLGQWLPPGAAGTLIRNLSYFPEANSTFAWSVLAVWAAAGLILTLIDVPGRRHVAVASTTRGQSGPGPEGEGAHVPAS